MRARLASCLFVSVSIAAACGGRSVQSDDEDSTPGGTVSDGATTSGGAASRGGRAGVGGTIASAGRVGTAGTAAFGGFSSAGTPSSGGACACPAILCAPSYVPVPNPDGCCFHCELDCNRVGCALIICGSGSHQETIAGQCCPTCVSDNCEAQQAGYQALRQQLVEKYSSVGCSTNADCTIYYEKNQCGVGCGIPIPIAAIGNLEGNLQSYAQSSCSPNCMRPVPPCDAPGPPSCVRGFCQ